LMSRATFDLIGIPPTPQEVDAFLADNSADAFRVVVDGLLARPQYGERWARHWLDVARYADTKGYVFEEERRYPCSYTFRDYVIRSFNEDVPFDLFIKQQLAADLIPGGDKRSLAALGYLTLGRRFLNNQADIIDDRIDVVSRGMMGLTMACARCHDHKFDPIPAKDYYSMYGVFASSSEPAEKPIIGESPDPKAYADYLKEKQKREDELTNFRAEKEADARKTLRERAGDYMLAAHDSDGKERSKADVIARERKLDPSVTQNWISALKSWKKDNYPVFIPWFTLSQAGEKEFEDRAKSFVADWEKKGTNFNAYVAQFFATNPPTNLKELATRYAALFKDVDKIWKEAQKEKAERLKEDAKEMVRLVLYSPDGPVNVGSGEIQRLFDVPSIQKVRALRRKVEELDATHKGAPPRAMALQDNSSPMTPHVFIRGNPANRGAEVPRQFPEILAGPNRKPFTKGSGRLEMAEAIASRDNPLTARVFANRVWLQHFGTPLVRTPSDFGLRSDPPSHPELLDFLAVRFMEEGWSIKQLHRLIMLSSVYQQGSEENPANAKIDPANQYYWKMNRQRLDFEGMRDSLLALSGTLNWVAGGQPDDLSRDPKIGRRTIYSFIERQNLPGMFRTFDFASPDATSPQRFATTVPQQALFMINSPFVVRQARSLLERSEVANAPSSSEKIRALYKIAFQRPPTAEELTLGTKFLDQQENVPPRPVLPVVWQYGYGKIETNGQGAVEFHPLPHFTGENWQGGAALPDEKLGWVFLNNGGGHPGNDSSHAAIRRWTAPRDATVSISGNLGHDAEKGDGVRGWIHSSRSGLAGKWEVHHKKTSTKVESLEVKQGDTIDFVVDCGKGPDSDGFNWSPTIKVIASSTGSLDQEWSAREDFSGPKEPAKPLNSWEKYAQVLLMANELVFVD
jgi:hypothetical protein